MTPSERARRANRECEQRMVALALGVWTQAELKPEDYRHPDYERYMVEKAEAYAESQRLTRWRRNRIAERRWRRNRIAEFENDEYPKTKS